MTTYVVTVIRTRRFGWWLRHEVCHVPIRCTDANTALFIAPTAAELRNTRWTRWTPRGLATLDQVEGMIRSVCATPALAESL